MKRRVLIAIILTLIIIAANAKMTQAEILGKPTDAKEISDFEKVNAERTVIEKT